MFFCSVTETEEIRGGVGAIWRQSGLANGNGKLTFWARDHLPLIQARGLRCAITSSHRHQFRFIPCSPIGYHMPPYCLPPRLSSSTPSPPRTQFKLILNRYYYSKTLYVYNHVWSNLIHWSMPCHPSPAPSQVLMATTAALAFFWFMTKY